MSKIEVSEINIVPIRPSNGLLGFASAVINQFYVGNIAIYTSPGSKLGYRLVFPNKKLTSGKVVDCFYPINREVGDLVTSAIIRRYIELMDNFQHVE